MNITSYNITDVSYHYIGLRVLNGMAGETERVRQTEAISRSVLKFVSDKALRLMLPEPRSTFEAIGEKVCQELVHFKFARSSQRHYELTEDGAKAVGLLASKQYSELRRLMACVHLQTYDNLRAVVQSHIEVGPVWWPIVTSGYLAQSDYIERLLKPTFGEEAYFYASSVNDDLIMQGPKKISDALYRQILQQIIPNQKMGVALFRAISDRLVSLRLLNKSRVSSHECEFEKTYSTCVADEPNSPWYSPLEIPLPNGSFFRIHFCEPDMSAPAVQEHLLDAVNKAFDIVSPEGGYYDIPEVRDWVCEYLKIPEAAFDDGINRLLDRHPAALSVGLRYDKITNQRRPLVRTRQATQLHNLIRRL